jgi:peptide/nickel transport system permease protein
LFIQAGRRLAGLLLTVLLGGLCTAFLVRSSPGFESDDRLLDVRLSAASRNRIASERTGQAGALQFYSGQIAAMLHGDLGVSQTLRRPIGELIRDRIPVTARVLAAGVAGGWFMALSLAFPSVLLRRPGFSRAAEVLSTILMALPAAAVGICLFASGGPVYAIVGLVLFPRLFEYSRSVLRSAYNLPHVLAANARGLHPVRILWRHVLPVCAPELFSMAGVSLTLAFGAAIPVEAMCDLPGVGQLAWSAAMGRDLPLLSVLTMCIALGTQLSDALSGCAAAAFGKVLS